MFRFLMRFLIPEVSGIKNVLGAATHFVRQRPQDCPNGDIPPHLMAEFAESYLRFILGFPLVPDRMRSCLMIDIAIRECRMFAAIHHGGDITFLSIVAGRMIAENFTVNVASLNFPAMRKHTKKYPHFSRSIIGF